MTTPRLEKSPPRDSYGSSSLPSALEVATFAVTLLENDPLYNSAHGAVFTRDGINDLEASVMVSRGFKKRGVGVTGLRHVRNPILLARGMLEAGEVDLASSTSATASSSSSPVETVLLEISPPSRSPKDSDPHVKVSQPPPLDVPSAQGHTLIHGPAAEQLAQKYGLELVQPAHFFTQQRWEEHIRALQREKQGHGPATWSADEFLPQGTCGAVCMDASGTICVATSTGGMTNKLTGRIGDTPIAGAGFWAEEWIDDDDYGVDKSSSAGIRLVGGLLKDVLGGASCLPNHQWPGSGNAMGDDGRDRKIVTRHRSFAASGTGNGDSFMRLDAVRSVAAMARWRPCASSEAIEFVAGPGGELQKSTGDRWGRAGEGEGGMIGIESVVERDGDGVVVGVKGEVVQAHNCGGMFRAWVDERGKCQMRIFGNGIEEPYGFGAI